MKLLYATSNPGKQKEVKKYLSQYGIGTLTPRDFGLNINVEETGNTLEENATLKAQAYIDKLKDEEILVMGDDTGVEIDALGGEPGIHVRRWKGYPMKDEEIIEHCLKRMKGVESGKRQAQFRTVIALGSAKGDTKIFEGTLEGEITEEPIKLRMEGFPFESIFYIPKYEKMLGEIHQMPSGEKEKRGFLSHREIALKNTVKEILKKLNDEEAF